MKNLPIDCILGWYSKSFKWFSEHSTSELKRELVALPKSQLRILYGTPAGYDNSMFSKVPEYVLRNGLLYAKKFNDRHAAFKYIKYTLELDTLDHLIPGQFGIFLELLLKRGVTLQPKTREYAVAKYGEALGPYYRTKVLAKANPYSVEAVMTRNGLCKSDALKVIEERKKATSGSLETFVKRYGAKEGSRRHKLFGQRSSHTKEKFKEKYGKRWAKKWRSYRRSKDSSSLEFWITKLGPELGPAAYKKKILACTFNYEECLLKFDGDEKNASKFYRDYCLRKTRHWRGAGNGGALTKESKKFFNPILDYLDEIGIDYIIGDSRGGKEYYIWDNFQKKIRYYDFCIPDIKYIIEFDGGTHPSPLLSKNELRTWRCFLSGVSAQTRLEDDNRKEYLAVRKGFTFSRIHVDEFRADPHMQIKKHLNQITKLLKKERP